MTEAEIVRAEGALTLPAAAPMPDAPASAAPAPGPRSLPMRPFRVVAVGGTAGALALAGWQISRVMAGEERLGSLARAELVLASAAALCVVLWTWAVVENARRLLATGLTKDPPSPSGIAAAWAPPLLFVAAAAASISFLERRLNEPGGGSTSTIPLALVCVALIATLFVSYRPLFLLSAVMRRLGGGIGDLSRGVWIPIVMVLVGAASLVALRAGGAYGDDVDGFAPAWALGVVAIPPAITIVSLAWRASGLVEDVVSLAYARRRGKVAAGVGRRDLGVLARALRADARPPIDRDLRSRIRLLPGASTLRLLVMVSLAALTLVSIVGALVMFLFWREAAGGTLVASQRERAWSALDELRSLERTVAAVALVVASVWTFGTVLNARLASGRRRNPLLAAAAWPAAGLAIAAVNERVGDDVGVLGLIVRFAVQAAVLYVPFFLLERTAVAVGARRSPLRLAWGLGVVLLVQIQGFGGLATLQEEADVDRFGRLAGYLALAALLELIATITVADASGIIGEASRAVTEKHNFLAEQRSRIDERAAARAAAHGPAPRTTPTQPRTEPSTPAPARAAAPEPVAVATSSAASGAATSAATEPVVVATATDGAHVEASASPEPMVVARTSSGAPATSERTAEQAPASEPAPASDPEPATTATTPTAPAEPEPAATEPAAPLPMFVKPLVLRDPSTRYAASRPPVDGA